MSQRLANIRIVPEVLTWARESAGLSREDLSRKIGSRKVNVEEWERPGSAPRITSGQLENIADAVKRPTATLLLNEPPQEPALPKDFRGTQHRPERHSTDLRRAIRRARRLQRVAANVFKALGEPVRAQIPPDFDASLDPSAAAHTMRSELDIPNNIHSQWKNPNAAFRGWRSIVEGRNILVFSTGFPREEAQGFSLSDTDPSVIMLSAKDPPTARCFTLWHEFGHLLLRDVGICLTYEQGYENRGDDLDAEDWCNRFAETMLVDDALLLSQSRTSDVAHRRPGYESGLRNLSGDFKVSQDVLLFRMRHLGILSDDRFWQEFNRVREERNQAIREHEEARQDNPRKGGSPNISVQVVNGSGQRLTRTLLQALDRGSLTHTDLADYFGARLKHLENIRREAHR